MKMPKRVSGELAEIYKPRKKLPKSLFICPALWEDAPEFAIRPDNRTIRMCSYCRRHDGRFDDCPGPVMFERKAK
jgi:hypothetical protein